MKASKIDNLLKPVLKSQKVKLRIWNKVAGSYPDLAYSTSKYSDLVPGKNVKPVVPYLEFSHFLSHASRPIYLKYLLMCVVDCFKLNSHH